MNRPNAPLIILVRPQLGENIGMCMRAMLNCGLTRLRLVNPRDGWPSLKAERASAGALAKMESVEVFDTMKDAIADCHKIYATTARKRELVKPHTDLDGALEDCLTIAQDDLQTAIVFGCERTGLNNDELSLTHHLMTIPLNEGFTSLNLAQAVLLVSYAWWGKAREEIVIEPQEKSPPATMQDLTGLFDRLETELEGHHFFREETLKPTMINNIRAMLTRGDLTEQEVRTFHGIISALIGKKH